VAAVTTRKRRKKVVVPKHLTDLEAIEMLWGPPDEILSGSNLRDYQNWMADKIKELDGVFLAAEMGLGKTAAVLKAVVDMIDAGEVSQVLIIAPLRVAEETWPEEIAKWDYARKLRYRVVTGTEESAVQRWPMGRARSRSSTGKTSTGCARPSGCAAGYST
jgi:SNF2 family DNA or RNA helicase